VRVCDDDELTSLELRSIADAVERLEKTKVRVGDLFVGRHRVLLRWHAGDQREESFYTVTGVVRDASVTDR